MSDIYKNVSGGINKLYFSMLRDVLTKGDLSAPRGMKVRELLAYGFKLNDPTDRVITLPKFETSVKYAEEELKWYLAATNRIDFSPLINRTWKRFSDDGSTVNSAYGYRMFGRDKDAMTDQWDWAVKKLRDDQDSRQAIILLNFPEDKLRPTKDFPCSIYLQMLIRNGGLHWITNMRSQDLYYGTRNDVYCFTKMQEMMAKELGVELGRYYHFCGSLHLYEDKIEDALELMRIRPIY